MKTAIIGAGISGAVLARELHDVEVFEELPNSGGRICTLYPQNNAFLEAGALHFTDSIQVQIRNSQAKFHPADFLKSLDSNLTCNRIRGTENLYTCSGGLKSLVDNFLKTVHVHFGYKLESLNRNDSGCWTIKFHNGEIRQFDRVILTPPLPQSLSLIKTPAISKGWEEFSHFYSEYKSILVLAGLWKRGEGFAENPDFDLSEANPLCENVLEPISISSLESVKNNLPANLLALTIQFRENFSSRNFERWEIDNHIPSDLAVFHCEHYFKKILQTYGISDLENLQMQNLFSYRWRYAVPDQTVFPAGIEINTNSEKFMEYLELGKKYNLWLHGDWVWGGSISRCFAGSLILAEILKG